VAKSSGKTVRFTNIVERSGTPHVHTLWLPPEKDPALKRAKAEHRVMTVASPGGGNKTDRGIVGFHPHAGKVSQFLIFPKALKRFEGAHVVGIKFDLIAQPKLADADSLKNITTSASKRKVGKKTAALKSVKAHRPHPTDRSAGASENDHDAKIVSFEPPLSEPDDRAAGGESKTTAQTRKKKAQAAALKHDAASKTSLMREVRAAIKELEAGKAVAAYQRLQRAVE
jgi:hypothetical protein